MKISTLSWDENGNEVLGELEIEEPAEPVVPDPGEEPATKNDVAAVYDALAAAFERGVNSIDE